MILISLQAHMYFINLVCKNIIQLTGQDALEHYIILVIIGFRVDNDNRTLLFYVNLVVYTRNL